MSQFIDFASSRPLITAAISFAAGIGWTATGYYYLPAVCAGVFLTLGYFGHYHRKQQSQALLIITVPLLFFFSGILHGVITGDSPKNIETIHRLFPKKREATVSGRLLTSPETGVKRTKLLLAADHLLLPENDHVFFKGVRQEDDTTTLLNFRSRPIKAKILLRMDGRPPSSISPGDPLLIRAVLSKPDRYGTPGSFDYPTYLARKSIYLQGWVKSAGHIVELDTSPFHLSLLRNALIEAEKLRHRINTFLTARLPSRPAGLYKAILTGDRAMVTPDILENFKKTGVMHLLAISGVHMGLLALCCGLGFNFLVRRSERLLLRWNARKIVCLLTVPVLFLYALIAGLNPPVLRALLMTVIFFLAILYDRQHHLPTHIGIAAFAILLVNPTLLFSASFQLSFAAVIGIIVVLPGVRQLIKTPQPASGHSYHKRLLNWLLAGILVSVAATLATLPLLLYYFNRFSPISPLTTLVIEPLICFWSLLIGLLSCPLIFIAPEQAEFLLELGSKGLQGADLLTGWLARLPFANIRLSTPSLLEVGSYYLLLTALFARGKTGRYRRLIIGLSTAVLIATPLFLKYQRTHQHHDRISFLDVGQGSCTVLETEGGGVTVIDGGGPWSERFNVGKAVIAPFLWRHRIGKIDHLIISHLDSDHYNGLPFIIRNFQPDHIWLNNPNPGDSTMLNDLLHEIRENEGCLKVPKQGGILNETPTSVLRNVTGLHLKSGYPKDNNRSLVLKLTGRGYTALFPGDIEKKAEKELLRKNRNLKADVLLAPHHGSISSSSRAFLKTVEPTHIVISAGKYQDDNFPAPEVLHIYRNLGSKVYNTARQGTITFTAGDSGLGIKTFRKH